MARRSYRITEDCTPGVKQNLVGRVYGYLTVIRDSGRDTHKNILWECICECGKTTLANTTYLKSGKKYSCGCRQYRSGKDVYNWTGYEEIPGSFLYSMKCNASTRGISYNVTPEYLWSLFTSQSRLCALSGVPISMSVPRTASLDRIVNSVGYVVGNLQWVHKDVNLLRNSRSVDDFLNWCHTISDYRRSLGHKDLG